MNKSFLKSNLGGTAFTVWPFYYFEEWPHPESRKGGKRDQSIDSDAWPLKQPRRQRAGLLIIRQNNVKAGGSATNAAPKNPNNLIPTTLVPVYPSDFYNGLC